MQYIFGKIPHVRMSLYDLRKKKEHFTYKGYSPFSKGIFYLKLKMKHLYVL